MSKSKTFKVEFTKSSFKELKKLDKKLSSLILRAIKEKLVVDPLLYGKPLRRSLRRLYRLRVGDYRVIYNVEKSEVLVLVVKVGHRKEIYES